MHTVMKRDFFRSLLNVIKCDVINVETAEKCICSREYNSSRSGSGLMDSTQPKSKFHWEYTAPVFIALFISDISQIT